MHWEAGGEGKHFEHGLQKNRQCIRRYFHDPSYHQYEGWWKKRRSSPSSAVIRNWKFVSAHNRCHPEPCQHTTPGLRFEFFQLLFSNISATSVDTDAGIVFVTDWGQSGKTRSSSSNTRSGNGHHTPYRATFLASLYTHLLRIRRGGITVGTLF